jgi:hypothetical protein
MKKIIRTAVIAVTAFLFALALTGCNGVITEGAELYTFRFKVQNYSADTITKIEFLNGTNRTARVLRYEEPNLGPNELSNEYKVRGFTEEYMNDERYCAVIITYNDEFDVFNYWQCGPSNSKILLTFGYDRRTGKNVIDFDFGTW